MQIFPIDGRWVYNYLIQPCEQGCELANRAWKGKIQSLMPRYLDLKERWISWLQGSFLLALPLINAIVWLAWKTFGKPDPLTDPFSPDSTLSRPLSPPPKIGFGTKEGQPKSTEKFSFQETIGGNSFLVNWEVGYHFDRLTVQQTAPDFSSKSVYRADLSLKQYEYQMGSTHCSIWEENSHRKRSIRITLSDGETELANKIFEPEQNLPWIQQRGIGLKPFLESKERECSFYVVIPEIPFLNYIPFLQKPPFLMPVKAKKMGAESISGENPLLKVEFESGWGVPYSLFKSEVWFDPNTYELRKFKDSGPGIMRTGERLQNHRSPESRHL